MEENQEPATDKAPENTPAETTPPESLENIAKEFSVEDQVNQFTAQPAAPQPPAQAPSIPDPIIDADGYRAYMARQAGATEQLTNLIGTISQRIDNFERGQQQQRIEADLKLAVSKVNEVLKVDPLLAEIALEKMYRTDANFQKIWDNRAKNPGAYEKALGLVAQKLAPTFAVRQDPQLTENQRAAQASTKTMASTAKHDFDPRFKPLYEPESQAEFDQAWDAFKRGLG
jgi:hypothetical protein